MNKFLFLGIAATMFLASCSSDSDIASGNTEPIQQVGNSDEPILLSLSQNGNITRSPLGNLGEDGKYDGSFTTAPGSYLGIYCLATGKIAGTENIFWNNDNPNFKWLENVKANAVTHTDSVEMTFAEGNRKVAVNRTNLTWEDGVTRYYPMGSQNSYTFYGYYPYSDNTYRSGERYYTYIYNLDGTKDVIWGKSKVDESDPDAEYAYSALYFRTKKNNGLKVADYLPTVTFKHKMMKFNIILKKGTGDNLDKIGVKEATLLDVATSGTLTIANNDTTDHVNPEGKFDVDWYNQGMYTLKGANDQDLEEDTYLGDKDTCHVGQGFLVPVLPKDGNVDEHGDSTYVDNGYHGEDWSMANKGVFRLRVDFKIKDDTSEAQYKAAQYEVKPPVDGWKEGYEYDIIISVSTPLEINANAVLTPWEKGTIELY